MTVYEAISRMRELTRKQQPFALSYMSCSLERRESKGEICVEHALLVKNPKDAKSEYRDYMLTYRDLDTGEARQLWQPLLMSLDHEPLTAIESE